MLENASTTRRSEPADETRRRCERPHFGTHQGFEDQELIVTLEPDLSTPAVIHDEIERHHESIVEKSGMDADSVQQFLSLLFSYVETVPVEQFHEHIDEAEAAMGETDPDDVLYLACAIGSDAGIWSDDNDFRSQDLVPVYTTTTVVDTFETR